MHEYVNCNVRLFADDCLLYRNVYNQSDLELLQKDLINLENWKKCYVIHVTEKKIPLKLNYKLHKHTLQPVDNSKYLGVTISNALDWGPHINNINTKTNKTFLRTHHLFVRLSNTLHQIGIHLKNRKYLRLSKYKGHLVQSPI